jgi:uncharacterized protein YjbJ (UPF0337 family)
MTLFVLKQYKIGREKQVMALPNRDEVDGQWEQTKGTLKEGWGKLTGDRETEAEGEAQQAGGEAQEGWGKVKRGIGETIDDIGDAISDAGRSVNR